MKVIERFNAKSYVEGVKSHIQTLLDEINKLNVKTKYEEITEHLYSLGRPYNQNLSTRFKNFKKELEKHKTSLEENIKEYIQKICTDLTKHSSCVEKLITKICDNIKSLEKNKVILGQFNYEAKEKIVKPCTRFESNQRQSYTKIFESHKTYKQCLESCYIKIKCELNRFMCELRYYNYYIRITRNSLSKYNDSVTDSSNISDKLIYLKFYESKLPKFDKYMECVKKLQKIGEHITTMKSELEQVKRKVDDKAEKYINGLKDIDIKDNEVKSSIKNIKGMNNLIIGKLKIAKHTIDFYQTLQKELDNLNGVTFNDYDFTLYWTVKQKVTSFESTINGAICKSKEEINKIKETIKEATKNVVICDGKKHEEQVNNDPISKVKPCIDDSVGEMKKFIANSLKDIKMIKHILSVLQDIKNDSPGISSIKSKVGGITNLNDATKTLTEARDQLNKFLQLQESTKFLIDTFSKYPKFSTLYKYLNPLEDSIGLSYALIGNIELSIKFLNGVTKVDYLIRWINSCYSSRFKTIKSMIDKFKGYVMQIITRLETINSNLCRLRWLQCRTSVEYNLWRFKVHMTYLKVYINNIRRDFNVICGVIDKIKKESSYFGRYRRELESLEKYIQCYINHINCNKNNNVLKEGVVKYLEGIKDKIKEILIVIKYIIDFHSHPKCINEIEGKLICVETSISELECAIEGVARNFIRCSTKQLSTHLINSNSIYHNLIVKDNIKII